MLTSLPESKKLDDAQVRFLSFDRDSADKYTAGFWGDSNPTPAGATYDMFKAEYIPYFIDKDYAYIKTLSTVDDIAAEDYTAGEGREGLTLDTFTRFFRIVQQHHQNAERADGISRH